MIDDRSVGGVPQGVGSYNGVAGDGIERNFSNSVSLCFKKYAVFSGRAPRAEFWYFALFTIVISVILNAASFALNMGAILSSVFSLVIFLPSLSVAVRRLHDLDRSGWWYWILLVPVIGFILLIVWFCRKGEPAPNQYGPSLG